MCLIVIFLEAKIEGEILFLGYYESEYNWEDGSDAQVRTLQAEMPELKGFIGFPLCRILHYPDVLKYWDT